MNRTGGIRAEIRALIGRRELAVDFDAAAGTLIVIGPNGSGKTSLLCVLLGAMPAQGRIQIGDDVLLDSRAGVNVPVEEREIGYVPQQYALFPHLDVLGNISFAVASAGKESRAAQLERSRAMMQKLGLSDLAAKKPSTLSGGEKQRVALARALSVNPRALLLDEPLAALDLHSRKEVRSFLAEHLRELAIPSVVVTHDAADAQVLGEKVLVLEQGRATQLGRWDELVLRPASRFVEEFVASARQP